MTKPLYLIVLLLTISVAGFGQVTSLKQNEPNPLPFPKVDQRIELLSIAFRLAGNSEYNMDNYKNYVNDIHTYFDKYKDHPLIAFCQKLREENGVSFDAVMAMAIHLKQPPSLDPIIPFTDKVPENRWGKDNAYKFVALLKQFYTDTHCDVFFKQHADLYRLAQDRFKAAVFDGFDISWYKQYYGQQPEGSLNVIIGLGNGGGNYGPKVIFADGKEDDYAIMGTWSVDSLGKPMYSASGYLPTLVHEFNHSFVNHLIEKYAKDLEASSYKLFEPVKTLMKSQAYSNAITMMKESLVRASVVMYIKKHATNPLEVNKEIITQTGRGFIWIRRLVDTLDFYEQNRSKYPTLESFMPRIISFYNTTAQNRDALLANCVHVKSLEPFGNNASDVSANLTEMKVVFDKPLSGKGYSIWLGVKGKDHYPITDKGVRFADNNTAVILKLKLLANTEYEFILVGQGFQTIEGYPLMDYKVSFKTK